MKRRRLFWLSLLLLLLVLAVVVFPASRWRIIGWVKGEAFYDGRPTSYWSERIKARHVRHDERSKLILAKANNTYSWTRLWSDLTGRDTEDLSDPLCTQESAYPFADTAAVPVMIELLGDPESQVRIYTCHALVTVEGSNKAAIPALVLMLGSADVYDRRNAASVLAIIGPEGPNVVRALTLALRDADAYVVYQSVRALGAMGPEAREAIPALEKLLDSEMAEFNQYAERAAPTIREAAEETLEKIQRPLKVY
jgi:hypothetical protein